MGCRTFSLMLSYAPAQQGERGRCHLSIPLAMSSYCLTHHYNLSVLAHSLQLVSLGSLTTDRNAAHYTQWVYSYVNFNCLVLHLPFTHYAIYMRCCVHIIPFTCAAAYTEPMAGV